MPSTRGFSATIDGGVGGGVPLAGDFDIYLDVAAGDDANSGVSWATAFLTWERAMNAAEQHLATDPSTEIITIYVDNSTGAALAARGFTIAPNLPDRCRLNVVCPTSRWTRLLFGTVQGAGITAEAGDALANVIVVGFVPLVTDVGKTLRLTRPVGDPNVGEILTATILAADVATNSYTVSVLDAVVPAFWDADAFTIAEVLEADSVINGTLVFSPKCGPQSEAALNVHKNWLFGIRANLILVDGDQVAMAACECRTAASAAPDGVLADTSDGGSVMRYITAVVGGVRAYLSDARARTWGIFGTTAVVGMCLGNGTNDLNCSGGLESAFSGYAILCQPTNNCVFTANRCRIGSLNASTGAHVGLDNFRIAGTAQAAAMRAVENGTYVEYQNGYLEEVAGGQAYIALSDDGAMIKSTDHDFNIVTVNAANYPNLGWVCDGAKMDIEGIADAQSAKIKGILLWAVNEAEFEVGNGGIQMVSARPGVANATDIVVHDGSVMTVDGLILKTVPNTVPGCCLDVDDCSNFIQKSGAFTHGLAPANWTNSYGALGLLHAGDDSDIVVGALTDGGVGVGAGIATQVRRKSSLWYGANSALTGAAICVVGVKAAAGFPGAAVLNDLPVAPNGAEELCVMGVTASP